jgi:hypothetical protein
VSDHVCFYVHFYLLDLSSTYERKHAAFVSWAWLTSLNMMSSNCIYFPSNHMLSLLLMAE